MLSLSLITAAVVLGFAAQDATALAVPFNKRAPSSFTSIDFKVQRRDLPLNFTSESQISYSADILVAGTKFSVRNNFSSYSCLLIVDLDPTRHWVLRPLGGHYRYHPHRCEGHRSGRRHCLRVSLYVALLSNVVLNASQ